MRELLGAELPTGYAVGERGLVDQFIVYRACWLAVGLLAITRERRRFGRPWLVRTGWVLSAVEFAWLFRRLRARDRFLHGREATIDAAVSTVTAAACLVAADPSEQLGELTNWAFSLGLISAATGPIASPEAGRTFAEAGAAAAVYGLTGAARRGAARQEVLANALQYLMWWAGGQTFAVGMRRAGAEITAADAQAATSATAVASIRERDRMHDELHVGAIGALEDVRAHWFEDRQAARRRADQEARRLRSGLRDGVDGSVVFVCELERLAAQAAHRGMRVEVLCDEGLSPPAHVAGPLLATTGDVLALLPPGGESPAILRATHSGDGPVVTIRYRGSTLTEECQQSLCGAGCPHCQVTVRSADQPGARIRIQLHR
jgi:hypothetical protein